MDESSIGIEPERPDVVEALKSMNWEERLAEARARRKAALAAKSTPPQKRIRVVDASKVTPLRPVTRDTGWPAEGASDAPSSMSVAPPPLRDETDPAQVAPAPPATAPVEPKAPVQAATVPDVAAAPLGRSLAGKTALGFGLGLGLGASVLVGALALGFGGRGEQTAVASVATPPAPAEVAAQPAAEVFPPRRPVPATADFAVAAATPVLVPAPVRIAAAGPLSVPAGAEGLPSGVFPDGTMSVANEVAGFGNVRFVAAEAAPSSPLRLPAAPHTAARPAIPAGPAPDAGVSRPENGQQASAAVELASLSLPSAPVPRADLIGPVEPAVALRAMPGAIAEPRVPDGAAVEETALVPPAPLPPLEGAGGGGVIPGIDRLTIHVHAPETVPDSDLKGATAALAGAGADLGEIRRVRFKVSENQVRYYFARDADAARALADVIGARARDFTGFRPSPPDGTVEVYLAGDSVAPPPRKATTRNRPQKSEAERLRDRIVQQLRRGEHL